MQRIKSSAVSLLIIAVVAVSFAIYLFAFTGCKHNQTQVSVKEKSVTYVEYPDVEQFYRENTDVKSIVPADQFKDILSEKEVLRLLAKRGFADITVTTEYDISGNYFEARKTSADSNEKHPIYQALYQAKNGNIWSLCVVGKQITAAMVMKDEQETSVQSVMLSENDSITGYDSQGNRFFVTVPHKNYVLLKTIKSIDAQTLEAFTAEEVAAL